MKCFFITLNLLLAFSSVALAQTLAVVTQEPGATLYAVDAENQTVEELYRERHIVDLAADPTTGIIYAYDANREELLALSDVGEEVVLNLAGITVDHLTNGPDGELYMTASTGRVYLYEPQLDSFYVLQGIESGDPIIASENYLVYAGGGRYLTRIDRQTLANPLELTTAPRTGLRNGAGIDANEGFLYFLGEDFGTMTAVDLNDGSAAIRTIPIGLQNSRNFSEACASVDGLGLLFISNEFTTRFVYYFDFDTEQVTQIPSIGIALKIATTAPDVISYIAGSVDATVFTLDINSLQRDGYVTEALFSPRHLRYDSTTQSIYALNKIPFLFGGSLAVYNLNTEEANIPLLTRSYREDDPITFDLDALGAPIIGVSPAGLRRLPCDTCQLDTLSFSNIPEPENVELVAVDPATGNIYYTTQTGIDLRRRLPSGEDEFVASSNGLPGFRDQLLFAPGPDRLVSRQVAGGEVTVYNIDLEMTTSFTIEAGRNIKSIALDPLDANKLYAILEADFGGVEELYEVSLISGVRNLLMPLPQGSIALTVLEGSPGISSSTTTVLEDDIFSAFYNTDRNSIRIEASARTSAISLTNARGQQLQKIVPRRTIDIDLSNYPSGIYIVSVVIDGSVYSKKVLNP